MWFPGNGEILYKIRESFFFGILNTLGSTFPYTEHILKPRIVAIVLPYIQEFTQNYHFNLFRKFGQHFPLHKYKLGYRKDEMEATKLLSYLQEFPQNYHFNLFRKFGQHFPLHKYKLGYGKDEMEATKLFPYIQDFPKTITLTFFENLGSTSPYISTN